MMARDCDEKRENASNQSKATLIDVESVLIVIVTSSAGKTTLREAIVR